MPETIKKDVSSKYRYDFDTVVNRRGTDSMKWNVAENELPMWVADMDFKTAPEIINALEKRISHGVFGYAEIPDEWYSAYENWWSKRHGLNIDRDRLIFCTGVVPAISSIVRKLTTPNENVLIQTPVYNIFFNSIINNGARVLESPLLYENGEYSIDWADLEEKLADPQTSLMILCNPHNPVGKIWDRETLAKIGELCNRYNVTVISDEIHCDLTRPGFDYVPFASVSDTCRDISITCIAPTKCFNIAGMQSAAVYVPNKFLHHKVWRGLNTDEVAEPNSFATCAAVAAFTEGEHWLEELKSYLFENRDIVTETINNTFSDVKAVKGDATYLVWIDCTQISDPADPIDAFIRRHSGLYVTDGSEYGSCGEGFLRMNVACPRSTLEDGLKRLTDSISEYKKVKKL
ncbi:MAG: pyridoxal phosphate-dependent aminotransferase [Acetatifactor sp.]|nr:pyridoxal phosphate-dependent aminotransferase [Acetatifactor sp.]